MASGTEDTVALRARGKHQTWVWGQSGGPGGYIPNVHSLVGTEERRNQPPVSSGSSNSGFRDGFTTWYRLVAPECWFSDPLPRPVSGPSQDRGIREGACEGDRSQACRKEAGL